jgi:virginiamycin A acetyltransferase
MVFKKSIKAKIHYLRVRLINFFIPELKLIIDKKIDLGWISKTEINTKKEELTKLYAPYQLNSVSIGKGTYISSNSKISLTNIGNFCSIGPNLVCGWGIHPVNGISTSPYFYSTAKQNGSTLAIENLVEERKQIVIGNDVFIGANVTILDGITIGDGAVIGAGAVVSKNIPDYAIAVGSPIQIKKYRFTEKQIQELKKIEWWNFDTEKLKMINECFFDIELFIERCKK